MEKWKMFEETDTKRTYVSTKGRVKSIDKETGEEYFHQIGHQITGYRNVRTTKTHYVHILVAEAFIPNPENKPTVNHILGVDAGDHVENLEWATYEEQQEHARRTGLTTPGFTPIIVLNSNGEIISQHETTVEAFSSYDGRQVYYNKDVQIVGNVIVMKKHFYNELSENEIFNICYNCFQQMIDYVYAVDGQIIDSAKQAAEIINYSAGTLTNVTKNKWSVVAKGHEVFRLKNRIGILKEKS